MTNKAGFYGGLAVCVIAAALMIAGVVDAGWGAAIGMVGIGLLGAAATRSDRTTP
ncbi:MAG: hypothetical protein ACR2QO_24945 [Acidimicrobiales bacterium]